ncbi:hypothetical protein [Pseudomonas sp. NPDC089534]|uniref:hypothetical protein n=1 Tax=Pseudomonas sp. NPDC089534 TaxID=3364468 RepID=UPI003826050C
MANIMHNKYTSKNYELIIVAQDESAGKVRVVISRNGSSKFNDVVGSFTFYNDRQTTVMWFTTCDSKWRLEAPYRNGDKNFDNWSATKTSIVDTTNVENVYFTYDIFETT